MAARFSKLLELTEKMNDEPIDEKLLEKISAQAKKDGVTHPDKEYIKKFLLQDSPWKSWRKMYPGSTDKIYVHVRWPSWPMAGKVYVIETFPSTSIAELKEKIKTKLKLSEKSLLQLRLTLYYRGPEVGGSFGKQLVGDYEPEYVDNQWRIDMELAVIVIYSR